MFLHHAYLIEGREEAVASVHLFILEKLGITLSGNPDFTYVTHESFGVDESRGLKGDGIAHTDWRAKDYSHSLKRVHARGAECAFKVV